MKFTQICLTILFVLSSGFSMLSAQDDKPAENMIRETLDSGAFLVFRSDTVLTEPLGDEIVHVIFINCNGAISTKLPGNVIIIDGELGVRSGAEVTGDVALIKSELFRSRRAKINGTVYRNVDEHCRQTIMDRVKSVSKEKFKFPAQFQVSRWGGLSLDDYNRVDGFSISWGVSMVPLEGPALPYLELKVPIATTRDAVGFDLTGRLFLDDKGKRYFGFRTLAITDTHDRWRLDDLSNTFKAFIAGRDHRYYFRREGYSLFYHSGFHRYSSLELVYQAERYFSLDNQSPFTLFATENFHPNKPVESGLVRSLILRLNYDDRNDIRQTLFGWNVSLETELAGGLLEGDHSFARADFQLERWHTLAKRHHLYLLFKGTLADGPLPFQRGYTLGNALRGYDPFEFSGDRMLLYHLSYGYSMPALPVLEYLYLSWRVETIFERGTAFFDKDPNAGYGDLKSDVGVGINGETLIGDLGFYYFRNFKNTGTARDRFYFNLRILVPGNR